jgi:hypothetical protein
MYIFSAEKCKVIFLKRQKCPLPHCGEQGEEVNFQHFKVKEHCTAKRIFYGWV